MNQQFQNIRNNGDKAQLQEFVQNSNAEELTKIVRHSICKTDSLEIFDDILQSFSDTEACQLKRHKLVKSTLKLLGKAKVPARDVDAVINRIIFDIPKYSKQYLVKLVDFCVVSICDNDDKLQSWKDLLPVLLEALENEKYITHEDAEVSGAEYKSLTIKRICDYRWNTDLLPSLAKMFGDMALDKNDHKEVLRTLCRALSDLSLDQVPPFVYQALKLCKVQDKQHLLDTLCKYFDNCYSKAIALEDKDSIEDIGLVSTKEVRDVESTVLYHVYQAALLNHENMKDFLRYFKSISHAPEYTLKPFVFAVLLSVSSIHEDQIFEILRLAIINNSLNKERRKSNAWLRQLLPSSCNIIEIIRQLVDSSNKDRHLVLKGLTDLAFMLMSSDQKVKNNATVVWSVGSEIVREVMKKRHETVVIVLQELVHKIVGGGISTTHYTDCLKYVCRELSVIVLDHQIWITTLLEQLLLLPTVVATQILYAIFPLMHVSPNIRVSLLLILRKALYRKGISKRQMAVTGFLEMLKYSKMHSLGSFRLSQRCNPNSYAVSSSSRSTLTQATLEYNTQKSNTDCDKTLCYEILDILKKSFTYEFEVRLHLYEGLYASVTKNLEITEIVLDMLLSHLNLYFDTDDNTLPPIKFEMCTSVHGVEIVLQEPIGELIFVVQKIYVDIFLKKSKTFDKLHTVLESLCARMAATELEHLNLEHGLDFSDDLMKSQTKLKSLGIAVTIYEALMAFRIGECVKGNQGSYGKINDLFNGYMRLGDFVKMQSTKTKKFDGNKSKKDKDASNTTKKHGKSNNIKMPSTIMDLDTIHQALILLYSRPSSTQNDVNLRENSNFCRYIFQTCEQILQRTKSLMADTSQTQPNQYIDTYIEIGGLFHEYFLLVLTDALADDEQLAILALQCFKEICSCICTTSSSSEFSRFLDRILRSKKDSVPRDVNSQLQEVVSSLDNYLIALIDEEIDSDTKNKVLLLLLQILEQFISKIDFEKCNLEKVGISVLSYTNFIRESFLVNTVIFVYKKKVHKCFSKMVRTENLASSIIPAIIQFLLRLEEYTQEHGETLNEICLKLCEKVGTIDGSEISMNGEYQIIREDTFKQIYNVLNDYIKEKLNNVSWLLLRLKAEDIISRAPGTIDEVWNNNLREKERNLCKQLSHLIHVVHILSNTAIDLGPCTDVTFKNLQCLYHLLGNLTKYFYAKSSNQNAAFQTAKFIQVVQLAGKPLKSAFYNLVTYVEENQNKLNSKSDSHARRNKILKETKVIPRVVYEIEQFNKEVLLLGKRTGIPLENYMKHSVTRDFRIKNSQLVESLEKMDTSMLTLLNSEDAENETHSSNCEELNSSTDQASPSRKRSRMED
ncbi:Fanconi anemia group I protein isoform X2 [Hylaeus anthracinus]|uniref:Fanconi anemia group I protein isoform X2 n=1 Tax=Hylaeus anthracinus TaxID=313031 RepID=UPI0023B8DEBF|nr:Fanconi anemia group I protein isoform X2 [Hylaeus anthracinus]